MIGIIIAVVIGIILIGLLFKLLKLAIIVALVVGGFMFVQDKLGTKRLKLPSPPSSSPSCSAFSRCGSSPA
jgi:hypothetical protein